MALITRPQGLAISTAISIEQRMARAQVTRRVKTVRSLRLKR
jgi:hypothetical protein